jgi:Cytochrome c554 and c-prime
MRGAMNLRSLVVVAVVAPASAVVSCSSKSASPTYYARETLLDPSTCKQCHADHYADWSASMHAYASDDPVFRAMNARGQRETNGALGDFCVKCHAPMAVNEGATTNGLNLDSVPADLHGVTCFYCHTVDAVNGTHNNPLALSGDITMRGEYSDPVANAAHPATYSALHDRTQLASAPLCGACHDIVSPAGAAIERTYADWQASLFSHAGVGDTCAQCHMDELPRGDGLEPIAQAPNVFARKYHVHSFLAVDQATTPPEPAPPATDTPLQEFLDTTVSTALCVVRGAGAIRVIVDNIAAGHSVPSGSSQDRRLWAEVIAYKAGAVIYQSGVVPAGTPVTSLTNDPDLWVVRDCMFGDAGTQVNMFWQAASEDSNLLPFPTTDDTTDPAYYRTHVVQYYPRLPTATFTGGPPDKVTLRLLFQPIGLDVLRDLEATGDLDAGIEAQIPTLVFPEPILTWTEAAEEGSVLYYENQTTPVYCVTDTGLNVGADKSPAVDHSKCTP